MGSITRIDRRSSATSPTSLNVLAESYRLGLEAQNKSPRTIQTYLEAIARLDSFLEAEGRPRQIELLSQADLEAFIVDVLRTQSPATAANRYRALGSFFRWAVEEEEIERSPMARMKPPKVPEKPVPVLTEDETRALLKACEGNGLAELRDKAIISLFLDTGMRRAELEGLTVDDIDLRAKTARVVGKGRRVRECVFGSKTAMAVDRYLRRGRARHRDHDTDALWLGHAGPMTGNGIYQAVQERAKQAGLEGIHPHVFRHTWAHMLSADEMPESQLMHLAGWKSSQMAQRYGSSALGERAPSSYRGKSPVDKL